MIARVDVAEHQLFLLPPVLNNRCECPARLGGAVSSAGEGPATSAALPRQVSKSRAAGEGLTDNQEGSALRHDLRAFHRTELAVTAMRHHGPDAFRSSVQNANLMLRRARHQAGSRNVRPAARPRTQSITGHSQNGAVSVSAAGG